ncbi:putative non-specific serine/threonine protein kinase [Helianthus anomalus]
MMIFHSRLLILDSRLSSSQLVLCCSGGSFEALWSRSRCVDRKNDTLKITQWCAPVLGWNVPNVFFGIFDAILKGYIVFESDPWPSISI